MTILGDLPAARARARRWALAILLLLASPLPAAALAETLPFDQLAVGMTGTGRTVWSGAKISEFRVEIVGLLENILPERDLILVRCTGGSLSETGIFQGMSGSPVYVRGKLIGALAYAFPFAKEAIGGVTPIAEMLAIDDDGGEPPSGGTASAPSLAPLYEPETLPAFFAGLLSRSSPRVDATAYTPMSLPLHVSGFAPEVLGDLREALGAGLIPAGGRSPDAAGAAAGSPLRAGSTVGVQLMRGDLDLTAIGTTTWVDDGSVLAFGHKFLNIGPTAMPMTSAHVHLVIPTLMSSFKVASPGEVIGTIRQDRISGLRGTLGEGPRLIPVRMELATDGGEPRNYAFGLVDDQLLTPLLLNYAIRSILISAEKELGPMTLRLRSGSFIRLAGYEPVELDNFYSGDFAAPFASGLSAYILYILMNNEYLAPRVEGIDLAVDFLPETRSAWIEEVRADRERVRAGDTVKLHITLRPYRSETIERTLDLEIPRESPRGRLVVRVGDGLTLARLETKGEPSTYRPRDFDQLVWLINQIRSFNRIYANVSIVDEGLLIGGTPMPNLPPSVAQVLGMPQAGGNTTRLPRRGLVEESVETEYAVTGYRKIYLEVIP